MLAFSICACLLLQGLRSVNAHYVFSRLVVNGTVSQDWEYVRNVTAGWAYSPGQAVAQNNPYYDIYDDNARCGRGAATSGIDTKTATVIAGDEVGFMTLYNAMQYLNGIWHPGCGQAYLSKAPEDLETYTGDGDWFKIGSIGPENATTWILREGVYAMNYTIPRTTPSGKYLLRGEHLYYRSSRFNDTQLYLNCAHIEVLGPGGGRPGPLVKFPGAYDLFERGIWAPFAITGYSPNLTSYYPPGPPVWTG